MLINTHIGFDVEDGMGVDGAEFQRELLQLDSMGKKRIQVWINSPGGNVMDGYNIFSAICDSKTPVDTYAKGMVASIAGAIFMAGRKRYMTDYSCLMMHNPFGGDDKKQLGVMKDSIATMIQSKSNIPVNEVSYMMDKTTWMDPAECYEKGFCNEIEVTSQANKKYTGNPKAFWKVSHEILNNVFTKNTTMTKVTNKLKLTDSANEDAIVSAIESIENNLTEANDALTAKADELKTAQDSLAKLQGEFDALKAEKDAADLAAKTAAETLEETEVDATIQNAVKIGKIKNEAVAEWKATAKAIGKEKLTAMINSLPLNKVGVKIEDKLEVKDGVVNTYNAASIMAAITAKNSTK